MNLAPLIDHTLLRPDSTVEQIIKLCSEARQHSFASVCVLPWHVARAAAELEGSTVKVCTVVGFPLGAHLTRLKVIESEEAIGQGATEIDMVASITALKSRRYDDVFSDIRAVVDAVHAYNGIVKVIIETCLLSEEEKKRMCATVTQAGADFIKTSTGFSTGGATLEDVALLRSHVGPAVRVKASGGIRDAATAVAMVNAGAERLGTSSGVSIIGG